MKKEVITSSVLNESYQKISHPSGLDMILYPMEGFSGSFALFATKYGSVDTTFKTSDDTDFITVPEGIAHFLEHKLFESEDGDAFARYAETGASANAYTSFDRTAYLFSASENFEDSLEILLDFVTDPYFTPETVNKEQGIIGQEIKMYQDDPDWRVFFNLLGSLYKENPVRIDIAGTVESIAQIDADLLYRCYNTFYNLNNMVLVIAGNFSPDSVITIADKILKPAKDIKIERHFPEEKPEVVTDYVEQVFPISQPMFMFGYRKDTISDSQDFIDSTRIKILLDIIFGEASPFYKRLYDQGLINDTFGYSSDHGRGYAFSSFTGESKDPKKVAEEIAKEIENVKKNGIDKEAFVNCKKSNWGSLISLYGNVSSVATLALSSHISGLGAYDMLDIVSETTIEELEMLLNRDFTPELSALSVVKPK